MTTQKQQQEQGGFTLVEVMVALALVILLASGLYATGLMVMRMTNSNRVAIEARALGQQMLEELSDRTKAELALLAPVQERTNFLQFGEMVVRNATVTGHTSGLGLSTNLESSAYMEVRVDVRYVSPLTQFPVTNTFTTLVNR